MRCHSMEDCSFDGFHLIHIGHNWMNFHVLDANGILKFKDKCRARELESDCIEKSANMRFGADRATCWPKLNCFHDEGTVAVYLLTCSRVIVSMYLCTYHATVSHWKYLFNSKFDNCIIRWISFCIEFCFENRTITMPMTMTTLIVALTHAIYIKTLAQCALHKRSVVVPYKKLQHFKVPFRSTFGCVQRFIWAHLCRSRFMRLMCKAHRIAHEYT